MSVVKIFKQAADANGGKFRKLTQSTFTKYYGEDDPSKKGVCRALCLAHSGLRAQGQNIGLAARGEEMYKIALSRYASKLQEDVTEEDVGTDMKSSLQLLYKRQSPLVGLALCGPIEVFQWRCHRQLAQLAEGTRFRVQVSIPNHVICVQMVGDNFEIYDPNAGALTVPVGKGFATLGFIYTHPEVTGVYNLVDGTEIYAACLKQQAL